MKSPIRILHIFNWFNQGGVENFVMNVYRNLDREKVQFDFAFITHKKGYFDEEALSLGANIYFYDTEQNTLKNHFTSLKRIINEHGPYAAVHSHVYFFSGYTLLIAKKQGVKIRISHSHDTKKGRKETLMRKAYEMLMRSMIHKNATHMLSCSDVAGKALFGAKAKYQVVYNGIDLHRFRYQEKNRVELRKKLGIENKNVVLNVGRFAEQKNHEFIISVFEELYKENQNVVLMLIGDGPLKEKIEKKLKDKELFDSAIILSNIGDTENYYCAADVFILPSLYEGMPIVSIEAQSTGLPCIISNKVTKEVAITDIIEYIDIIDAKKWAEKINKIFSNRIDRIKYNQQFEMTPFNIHYTVNELMKIYLQ